MTVDKDKLFSDINDQLDISTKKIIANVFDDKLPEKLLRDLVFDVIEDVLDTLYERFESITLVQSKMPAIKSK